MRRGKVGTTETMDLPLPAGDRGAVMGAVFQGHLARAQPHEGNCKRMSSSLHRRFGTANRVPVHIRGAALPPPCKVQNASDRNVRRNKRPCRLPQYLQESDGATRIPGSLEMQSLRYHAERPGFSLVQQTPAIIDLILQIAIHRVRLSLHRSSNVQETELSLADHKAEPIREPEVLCRKVQRIIVKGRHPKREVFHNHFHCWARRAVERPDVFHLKKPLGKHGRGPRQSKKVHQRRGSSFI